jgi:hypothetical protein
MTTECPAVPASQQAIQNAQLEGFSLMDIEAGFFGRMSIREKARQPIPEVNAPLRARTGGDIT